MMNTLVDQGYCVRKMWGGGREAEAYTSGSVDQAERCTTVPKIENGDGEGRGNQRDKHLAW